MQKTVRDAMFAMYVALCLYVCVRGDWHSLNNPMSTCFWLISPKWPTFQAKDMHIRE